MERNANRETAMSIDEFLRNDRIKARKEAEKRQYKRKPMKRRPNLDFDVIAQAKRDILRGDKTKDIAARYSIHVSTVFKMRTGRVHADIRPAK